MKQEINIANDRMPRLIHDKCLAKNQKEIRRLRRHEKENRWANSNRRNQSDPLVVRLPKGPRSALQTLHKESSRARDHHYYQGGLSHDWAGFYENSIGSDRSCINEWNVMDSLESKRPPSPNSLSNKEETEVLIRIKLKEIMMSVDIDEVTPKFIRQRLEEDLNTNLFQYKSFIDQEMLTILGQMDAATEVFSHVYLGSEWNASNLEELKRNGVGYILNVTKEIDNFFPGMFDYLNIRVYDDEKTELLKHWDDTFKYINQAKIKNSKVLVHCKMGISRSASVVIAYAMKEKNMSLEAATELVKNKRSCIKPNQAFKSQLKIYQGILDASRQRHNILWRSKSETNLKSPVPTPNKLRGFYQKPLDETDSKPNRLFPGDIPPFKAKISSPADINRDSCADVSVEDAHSLIVPGCVSKRPKSWSPDDDTVKMLFSEPLSDIDYGESLAKTQSLNDQTWQAHVTVEQWDPRDPGGGKFTFNSTAVEAVNTVLVDTQVEPEEVFKTSVKERINEFEKEAKSPDPVCSQSSENISGPDTEVNYVAHVFPGPKDERWLAKKNVDPTKKDDPFSEGVDQVFEAEEQYQRTESSEGPSRTNSWGSFDSAVFVGERELPSRQSSWGSCDTRISGFSHISRNSSFTTHDKQPDTSNYPRTCFEVDSNSPATIRRNKTNKPSEMKEKTLDTPIQPQQNAPNEKSRCQLSPFMRSLSSSCVIGSNSQVKCAINRSMSEKRGRFCDETPSGKVKKLTKALENKAQSASKNALRIRSQSLDRISSNQELAFVESELRSSQSLLSRLVDETEVQAKLLSDEQEEIGVKTLVNRFEKGDKMSNTIPMRSARKKMRPRSEALSDPLPPVPQRKSSLDIGVRVKGDGALKQSLSWSPSTGGKYIVASSPLKPPGVPGRQQTCGLQVRQKKQQGKTHPLSKLVPRDS